MTAAVVQRCWKGLGAKVACSASLRFHNHPFGTPCVLTLPVLYPTQGGRVEQLGDREIILRL